MTAHLSTPYLRDMGAKAADLVASSLTPAAAAYLNQPVDHLASLPWPFADDVTSFRYTVNVDPARCPGRRGPENGAGTSSISAARIIR